MVWVRAQSLLMVRWVARPLMWLLTKTPAGAAESVNLQTQYTGVTATARTEVELKFAATGAYSSPWNRKTRLIQRRSRSVDGTGTTGSEALSKAVQAINEQSSKTGVVASLNKDATGIVLSNNTGNTIAVGKTAAANAGDITVTKQVGKGDGSVTTAGTPRHWLRHRLNSRSGDCRRRVYHPGFRQVVQRCFDLDGACFWNP